jgi:hypothetical protein
MQHQFVEEIMFLIFENSEIINLDNVVTVKAEQKSDDKVEVVFITTAIKYYLGDGLFEPEHYNFYYKKFDIKNEKWFELLDALKQGQDTFVCSESTEELNT